jgi:hypothetical protein
MQNPRNDNDLDAAYDLDIVYFLERCQKGTSLNHNIYKEINMLFRKQKLDKYNKTFNKE